MTRFRQNRAIRYFSEYCGLGLSNGPPQHETDAACREHDEGYETLLQMGINPYTSWNVADRQFIETLQELDPSSTWREYTVRTVAEKLFRFKRWILDNGNPNENIEDQSEESLDNLQGKTQWSDAAYEPIYGETKL